MWLSQALRLSGQGLEIVGGVHGRRRGRHFDEPSRFPLAVLDRLHERLPPRNRGLQSPERNRVAIAASARLDRGRLLELSHASCRARWSLGSAPGRRAVGRG